MTLLNHSFFGIIDTEKDLDEGLSDIFEDGISVLWEGELNGIMLTLWHEEGSQLTEEKLNTFQKFLKDFNVYDKRFRTAIENYLKDDNDYISFHIEELNLNVPPDAKDFAEKMVVTSIDFWTSEDFINIDYAIEPDKSDEVLCIKLKPDFDIDRIDWES